MNKQEPAKVSRAKAYSGIRIIIDFSFLFKRKFHSQRVRMVRYEIESKKASSMKLLDGGAVLRRFMRKPSVERGQK